MLQHLNQKDKAWRLIDSHAGAGAYLLHSEQTQKHAEYRQGLGLPKLGQSLDRKSVV